MAELAANSEEGKQSTAPVTEADINKLKSVYDKLLAAKNGEVEAAKKAASDAQVELDLIRKDVPMDKAAAIEKERDLSRREVAIRNSAAALEQEKLKTAAIVFAATAKSEYGVDVPLAELQKLGSPTEMESFMLRQVLAQATGKKEKAPAKVTKEVISESSPRYASTDMTDALTDLFRKKLPNYKG